MLIHWGRWEVPTALYVHTHCVQVGDDEVDGDGGEGVDASSVEDNVGEASEVVEICDDELYNTEQVKEKEKKEGLTPVFLDA